MEAHDPFGTGLCERVPDPGLVGEREAPWGLDAPSLFHTQKNPSCR